MMLSFTNNGDSWFIAIYSCLAEGKYLPLSLGNAYKRRLKQISVRCGEVRDILRRAEKSEGNKVWSKYRYEYLFAASCRTASHPV